MDKYYGREEEVEAPETQLDNFRAQAGVAQSVEVWANETYNNLTDQASAMWHEIGALREAAEARGDMQEVERLVAIQNSISEVHVSTQHIYETLIHANAGTKSILETAQALAKQKQVAEEELDKLTTAVEEADFSDPRIEQMAEMIETDLYEMISYQESFYDPSEDVYDNAISEMAEVVRKSLPQTPYAIVDRLFHTLLGDYEMDEAQHKLLADLVNTITLDDKSS